MERSIEVKVFQEFHSKIAMLLRLPETSGRLLDEFVSPDVNTAAVARIVRGNQYIEHLLLQEIRALGLKENTPGLQAAIALLGMSRTRDLVCALQMMRSIGQKHPETDKNGKLQIMPSDALKHALRAEDYAAVRRLPSPDLAYAAGLIFDLMAAVARDRFGEPDGFADYSKEVFKHGLRTGLLGVELARTAKLASYSKHMFAAGLLHDVGKLALELLFPPTAGPGSYAAFRAQLAEHPVSPGVARFVEGERFGLTHEHYSSMMIGHSTALRALERALLFHHEPYLLKSVGRELWSFAALLGLASNMAQAFRTPRDEKDPIFSAWLTPELAGLQLEPRALSAVMQKVANATA